MSMEEIDITLAQMGVPEEEWKEIKDNLVKAAEACMQTLSELWEKIKETIASAWEGVKDKMEDFANKIRSLLDITEKEKQYTKIYVSYNPPTGKEWYNQYSKRMIKDTRRDLKRFTVYKSGGKR